MASELISLRRFIVDVESTAGTKQLELRRKYNRLLRGGAAGPRSSVRLLSLADVKGFFLQDRANATPVPTFETLAAQVRHDKAAQLEMPNYEREIADKVCGRGFSIPWGSLTDADKIYGCISDDGMLRGLATVMTLQTSVQVEFLCSSRRLCGSKLLRRVERDAKNSKRTLVFLEASAPAVGFYKRMGYEILYREDADGMPTMGKYVGSSKKPPPPRAPGAASGEIYRTIPRRPTLRDREPGSRNEDVDNTLNTFREWPEISLSNAQVSDQDVANIATAISTVGSDFGTLDVLLQNNHITAQGAAELFAALRKNPISDQLILSNNQLGDEGAAHLAEVLPSLQGTVHVDANQIGDRGAASLARALLGQTSVKSLDLSRNEVSDEGATALAQALGKSANLRFTLDLSHNLLTDNSIPVLQQLALDHDIEVRVGGNDGVSEQAEQQLVDTIRRRSRGW